MNTPRKEQEDVTMRTSIRSRKESGRRSLSRGAQVYYHGRVYENGEPTLAYLDIENQVAERQACAREMIGRVYPRDKEYNAPPLIVQELRADIPLPATTAGRYLQMTYDQVTITLPLPMC
jgi:hypothetical protein